MSDIWARTLHSSPAVIGALGPAPARSHTRAGVACLSAACRRDRTARRRTCRDPRVDYVIYATFDFKYLKFLPSMA
jgi:hypothetical protein